MQVPGRSDWGPVAWRMLHYFAISFPETPSDEEQARALRFLRSYADWLPCDECRENLAAEYENFALDEVVRTRKELVDFTHALHNRVNARLNKPQLSLQQFYAAYAPKPKEAKAVAPAKQAPKAAARPKAGTAAWTARGGLSARALPKAKAVPKSAPKVAAARSVAPKAPPKAPPKAQPRGLRNRTVKLPPIKPAGTRSGGCAACRK